MAVRMRAQKRHRQGRRAGRMTRLESLETLRRAFMQILRQEPFQEILVSDGFNVDAIQRHWGLMLVEIDKEIRHLNDGDK